MSDFFNEAYRRARGRFTQEQWLSLPPQQVTEAIYQAMREMDAAGAGPPGGNADKAPDNEDQPEP